MELRKLTIQNIEDIKAVILDAFTGEPWNDNWQDLNIFHQYILDLIDNKNSLSLGLYDDDRIVGVAIGRIKHWYTGQQYWIDDLGIISNCQRKGYGTAFVTLMEEYLRQCDIKEIVLMTEKNIPAFDFWVKNSFELKDERVVFLKNLSDKL